MADDLIFFPMSDAIRARVALRAARLANLIADSHEFDGDAVRLFLARAQQELQQLSTAAGIGDPAGQLRKAA